MNSYATPIVDDTSIDDLKALFTRQKAASNANPYPSYQERRGNIEKLLTLTEKHKHDICEAIDKDFGNRSVRETTLADLMLVISGAKHARRHLRRWMRTRRVGTTLHSLPATSKIMPQPLGVIGNIAPWNYPYAIALLPAVHALAAGNRMMIKPSEVTVHTTELLGNLVSDNFDEDLLAIVTGGPELGNAFAELPFDHLIFTGSTAVGRKIAQAAAPNLTPITLELGGKCPAIIDHSYDPAKAVNSILRGKVLNCGQTCIGVDYVFVPTEKLDGFVEDMKTGFTKFFPKLEGNEDYTTIISDRHYDRLRNLVTDARDKGAKVVTVNPDGGEGSTNNRVLPLNMVINPSDDMTVMQEEVFGPVLSIKTYDRLDEVTDYINSHDRPLALYWFGHDRAKEKYMLQNTWAGGMCVNETLFHVFQEKLPFGGIGASGMGTHTGKAGFDSFSAHKPVFRQARLNSADLLNPPYGKLTDTLLAVMKKIV